MSDDVMADDQSHYEISLTAGQAFVAFVLLLLSLAASFGFGLMIGRGQGDDRLVVRKESPVVSEASALPKKPAGRIVELGLAEDDFQKAPPTQTDTAPVPVLTDDPAASAGLTDTAAHTDSASAVEAPASATQDPAKVAQSAPVVTPPPAVVATAAGPVYAQLLSTGDQKTAEKLAADLIDHGFRSAYVQRGANDKGSMFRVRVKFPSDAEARAAEPKLHQFSKDVWITR